MSTTRHRNPLAGQFPPVGAVYFNDYGCYVSRVLSKQTGPWGWEQITVQAIDYPHPRAQHNGTRSIGEVWSHSTVMDDHDEILELPEETTA